MTTHRFYLFFGIFTIAVEGNDNVLAKLSQVFHMLVQIPEARLNALYVGLFYMVIAHASVHFKSLKRNNEHGYTGLKPRLAALDVVELLRSEVGSEACFGHGKVAIGERRLRSHHRIAPMRNVGKGPAVDKCRCVLGGLHKVGAERVG